MRRERTSARFPGAANIGWENRLLPGSICVDSDGSVFAAAIDKQGVPSPRSDFERFSGQTRDLKENIKEQRTVVRCSLACTLPQVLRQNALLVERVEAEDGRFGVGASACRIDTNHCIFLSAETANTGLVDGQRTCLNAVANQDGAGKGSRSGVERVSALSAARRIAIVGQ